MTANEWLGVMKQAQDFPKGMEKLIVKYGEMLITEHESKVKKLTIPDVSGLACKCGNMTFTHRHSNWIECAACNKIQVLQACR